MALTLVSPRAIYASPGNELSQPYNSSPTANVVTGTVSNPTNAYDGNNGTSATIRVDEANALEVKTFSTAGAPTTEIIAFVDLKIRFEADAGGDFRIIYYVGSSAPVVLQDWTTSGFSDTTYVWADKSEPNDGAWSWTDIGNIRLKVEGRADGGVGGAQNLEEYEAWVSVHSYRKPTVYVYPASQTNPASPFTVDIKISTVDELYGWEFKLYYTKNILTISSYTLGPLLNGTVGTANTWGNLSDMTDNYDATRGRIWLAQSILGDFQGNTTDSGTLATLTFTTDGPSGTATLDLADTKLIGYDHMNKRLTYMTHDTTDGTVIIAVPEFPMGLALEIALIVVVIYLWQRRRRKEPKNSFDNSDLSASERIK